MRHRRFLFFLILWLASTGVPGTGQGAEVEFRADHYTRDFANDTLRGRGKAWVRLGERQVWADEIEVDLKADLAVANGNVHIQQPGAHMWASHASYKLTGQEATLEDATLIAGQMVLTGTVIEKITDRRFRLQEGSYSNCNVDNIQTPEVSRCRLDWKIYGRRLDITLEEYAHVYDAIGYVKGLPVFYTPYFVVPVKSERQSGLLMPYFTATANLGSGVTLPYYLALAPWQDLTLYPTYYSKFGYHVGLNYRYAYSRTKSGFVNLYFTERRFSPDIHNPAPNDPNRPRTLGLIGEWAVRAKNEADLWGRAHTRQHLLLVSHPYYTLDYEADLGESARLGYLRSLVSYTHPWHHYLFTARAQHHQSLMVSKDEGVDRGAVVELPSLTFSRTNTPLLGNLLSLEVDAEFNNFVRGVPFDNVPANPKPQGLNFDSVSAFDGNDYVRTGRRLRVEPRLIANVPMVTGVQFQPRLSAGATLYHFETPDSQLIHRGYLEAELPLSLYLTRTFDTGIPGYEKVNHVLQPRLIYATRPLQSLSSPHPFFCQDPVTGDYDPVNCQDTTAGRANPRFDLRDQLSKFEYVRFELLNRFRRQTSGGIERFFLLQLSQQYNLSTFPTDPRFSRRLGPIEILGEWRLWRLSAQIQAAYDLEETVASDGGRVHENTWSTSLRYDAGQGDFVRVNTLLKHRAERPLTEQWLYLHFRKRLPTFFDLSGDLEYSLKSGEFLGYGVTFHFHSKPASCWDLMLTTGRNSYKQAFTRLNFQLDFGAPSAAISR